MRILVTGAGGFLGRSLVGVLGRRGHDVRALLRPGSSSPDRGRTAAPVGPAAPVEEVRADLSGSGSLDVACEGVEAVVHLAASLRGDPEDQIRNAVLGTERLLAAMDAARVRRLVLASSLSVYDWRSAAGEIDERSPLEPAPETRDGYARAKLRQELLVREAARRSGISCTVLRPGMIWGKGREYPPTLGQRAGPVHLLFGGGRQFLSVHIENCADAFASALESGKSAGETFDVVDHPEITVRRFARDYLRRSGRGGLAIPLSYGAVLASVRLVHAVAPRGLARMLPSFLDPSLFVARYKPVRITGARIRSVLGWRPPFSHEQALDLTFGAADPPSS